MFVWIISISKYLFNCVYSTSCFLFCIELISFMKWCWINTYSFINWINIFIIIFSFLKWRWVNQMKEYRIWFTQLFLKWIRLIVECVEKNELNEIEVKWNEKKKKIGKRSSFNFHLSYLFRLIQLFLFLYSYLYHSPSSSFCINNYLSYSFFNQFVW